MYIHRNIAGAHAAQHQSGHRGAGAGAAGERLAAAALPNPHHYAGGAFDINKLGVDPFGERRVVLKLRADCGQGVAGGQGVAIRPFNDAVRVAGADAGGIPGFARCRQRGVDQRPGPQPNGGQGVRHRRKMSHFGLPQPFAFAVQRFTARHQGVDLDHILRHAVRVQKLRHTAHPVAAHFALGAIRVEHPHGGVAVRRQRRADADNAVRPNGKMPARKFLAPDGNLRRQAGFAAVKIDIVVAAAVHFGKVQLHKVPPCCAVWKESNKRIKKKE